ncbi:MAG: LLM class flavin-dependent oxidoreductase [Salinigranum sp.]
MRLGYSITSFHGSAEPRAAARSVLRRAEVAREAGFDYVQVGDHHVVADGLYLQNVPTAARLGGVFDRVGAMFLLPLYDPVLLAEQVGTLDALVEGFDFWCALGYQERSFRAFDVPMDERVPRFEEALDLLGRLWREDEVTFRGRFYDVEGVSVNPKADPRVVIGGGVEAAVRRAARLGDAWVSLPNETLADLEREIGWVREEGGGEVLARRDVVALEDGDRARAACEDLLAAGYRGWPADAEWPLAGDADDLAAAFGRLRDLGVDEVVVRPMSDEHAEETLRVVAEARDRM